MTRTNLLFALLLIVCISGKAQNSATVYDGSVWNKGDALTVGYHYFASIEYVGIKEKIINEQGKAEYIHPKEENILFSKLIIEDFITPDGTDIFFNTNQVAVAKSNSGRTYCIEIDRAIEKGEIVSSLPQTLYEDATFLSNEMLMACLIRVNGFEITNDIFLRYLGCIDKQLEWLCMADEFELHKAKKKYMPVLHEMIDNFDFSKIYYVKTDFIMEQYDFDANGYRLVLFPDVETLLPYGKDYVFAVEVNQDKFGILPLRMEDGEKINKRRKGLGRYGYAHGTTFGKFYFKLLDIRPNIPLGKNMRESKIREIAYRKKVVSVELIGLEVYDYHHCEYNFIGKVSK